MATQPLKQPWAGPSSPPRGLEKAQGLRHSRPVGGLSRGPLPCLPSPLRVHLLLGRCAHGQGCPEGYQAASLSSWVAASCHSPESKGLSSLQPVAQPPARCSACLSSPLPSWLLLPGSQSCLTSSKPVLLSTFLPTLFSSVLPRGLERQPHPFHTLSFGHSSLPKPHTTHTRRQGRQVAHDLRYTVAQTHPESDAKSKSLHTGPRRSTSRLPAPHLLLLKPQPMPWTLALPGL